jgi:hypothetical protein
MILVEKVRELKINEKYLKPSTPPFQKGHFQTCSNCVQQTLEFFSEKNSWNQSTSIFKRHIFDMFLTTHFLQI